MTGGDNEEINISYGHASIATGEIPLGNRKEESHSIILMSFTSPGMIRPSDATRLTLYPRHIIKAGEDNMGLIASSDWHPLIISFLGSGLHGPPCSLRHDSLLGWWFLTEISWIGFPAVTTIRRKLRQKKTMRTAGKKDSHYIYPSKSFLPPVPPDDQHLTRRI